MKYLHILQNYLISLRKNNNAFNIKFFFLEFQLILGSKFMQLLQIERRNFTFHKRN